MPITTVAYLLMFLSFSFCSVILAPAWGAYAYVITYNLNPLGQWWGGYLPGFLARYSYILALVMAAGIFAHHKKLRFTRLLERQEVFFLLLVGWIGISGLMNGQMDGYRENFAEKMLKVGINMMMITHIITTFKDYRTLAWVLVLINFYLGLDLFGGAGEFRGGRLHAGVGGSDFAEGNFLAAHFGFVLSLLGALFLRGGWKVKAFCVLAGVFITNGLIMARSRGALLALGAGGAVALWATYGMEQLRKHRTKIIVLLLLGLAGGVYLTDDEFWVRMSSLLVESEEERDASAEGRLVAWQGAVEIFMDHPMGVGPGNFFDYIGLYQPTMAGRDTHNTYLRCAAELGIPGALLLGGLILSSYTSLGAIRRRAIFELDGAAEDFVIHTFALRIGMVIYLTAGLFITATYVEDFYWMLLMPVMLKRALDNKITEVRAARARAAESAADGPEAEDGYMAVRR